jgi:hypothetical protein
MSPFSFGRYVMMRSLKSGVESHDLARTYKRIDHVIRSKNIMMEIARGIMPSGMMLQLLILQESWFVVI